VSTREAARCLGDARRRLDERSRARGTADSGAAAKRLKEAKRRLQEDHQVQLNANAAYENYRRNGRMRNGRRLGAHSPPKPYEPPEAPEGKINLTDLDPRNIKTPRGGVQGYNAQAVTTADQIVIAAEVTVDLPDFGHLEPMVRAAQTDLRYAGVTDTLRVVLADAGYWHQIQMQRLMSDGVQVLVPPDANKRKGERPGWQGGLYALMRRVLATERGGELTPAARQWSSPSSPTPSSTAAATDSYDAADRPAGPEWRLIHDTHNLLKLYKHTTAPAAA
jgi:hypothetical protein